MKRGPSGPLLSSSCSALGRALVRLTPVETALCRTLQRFRYLSLLGEDFKRIVRSPSRLATPWWGESTRLRSSPPPSCRLPQKTVGRPLPMPRSIVPRPCWGERRRLTIHHGSCIGGAPFIVRGRTHDHPTPTQSPAVEAGWLPRSRSRTRARLGTRPGAGARRPEACGTRRRGEDLTARPLRQTVMASPRCAQATARRLPRLITAPRSSPPKLTAESERLFWYSAVAAALRAGYGHLAVGPSAQT